MRCRGGATIGRCGFRVGWRRGCCTSRASPVLVRAWQPAADRVVLRARGGRSGAGDAAARPDRGAGAGGPRGAGAGDRADALRARGRLRPRRVPSPLSPRPAGRAADPAHAELPAAAPGLALGGALRGGGRAADRGPARGHDRAPHRRPLGAADRRGARRSAGRADGGDDRRPSPGGTGGDGPGPDPGGGAAAGGNGGGLRSLPARLAGGRPAPVGDAPDRSLDGPVPGPVRARRDGFAAGRRPRLHQARRPPRRSRPPCHRRRGGGVLRAV